MHKKIILFTFIALSYCAVTYAQRGPNVGVGGSFNSTWILWPNDYGMPQLNNKMGSYWTPSYGNDFFVSFNQNFVDVFGIRAELASSTQNQNFKNTSSNGGTRKFSLKYVQIPVMARFTSAGHPVRFHVYLGPRFGYLQSATQSNVDLQGISNSANVPNVSGTGTIGQKTITDRYNRTEIMGVLELGADFFLTDRLYIDAGFRVHDGYLLSDINAKAWRAPDNSNITYKPSYNAYAGLTVGINYALKYWH